MNNIIEQHQRFIKRLIHNTKVMDFSDQKEFYDQMYFSVNKAKDVAKLSNICLTMHDFINERVDYCTDLTGDQSKALRLISTSFMVFQTTYLGGRL